MTTSHHTRTVMQRILAATALTLLLGLSAACGNGSGDDDSALPDAAGASSASPSGAAPTTRRTSTPRTRC